MSGVLQINACAILAETSHLAVRVGYLLPFCQIKITMFPERKF